MKMFKVDRLIFKDFALFPDFNISSLKMNEKSYRWSTYSLKYAKKW